MLSRQNTFMRAHDPNESLTAEQEMQASLPAIRHFLTLDYNSREPHIQQATEFIASLKFFKRLAAEQSSEALTACLRHCDYLCIPAKTTVIQPSSPSTKLYIILLGAVEYATREDAAHSKVLGTGESFGERALAGTAQPVWVRTRTETHFATISSTQYRRVVSSVFEEHYQLLSILLQSLPTLKDMSKPLLEKICHGFKKRMYMKREVVYAEGDEPKHVHLVAKGEVRVSTSIVLEKKGPGLSTRALRETVQLAALGPGELFGEEELFAQDSLRKATSTAYTETCIYSMSKENFYKLLANNEEYEALRRKTAAKQEARARIIANQKYLLRVRHGLSEFRVDEESPETAAKRKRMPIARHRSGPLAAKAPEWPKLVLKPIAEYLGTPRRIKKFPLIKSFSTRSVTLNQPRPSN